MFQPRSLLNPLRFGNIAVAIFSTHELTLKMEA
jgi:hypothetical protein